jgi:metallo-beta-lactamase class B
MTLRLTSHTLVAALLVLWTGVAATQPPPARISPRNDLSTMARDPFQIFDNLYFVGIGEVGSYVIETSEGLILIDTLWDLDGYTDYHLGNIREVGLDPLDIEYVIIMQGHRDHYGGAPALREILDAEFGTHEEDYNLMVSDWGEYAPEIDFFIADGDSLTLGDTTLNFEHTPGHTPGTTSIRMTVYDNGTPYNAYFHGGPAVRSDDPEVILRYIQDLERINELDDIQVQIANHFDIHAQGAPDTFGRAAMLAERGPGDPHPWVDPAHFHRWLDELIAETRQILADAQ